MTLVIKALKLSMGCAPQGPAGTGKTETTKDLAAMMAVCIYVFNCAPEMDYRSMGDIWKGLGASGGLNYTLNILKFAVHTNGLLPLSTKTVPCLVQLGAVLMNSIV
jgi:hypothetical protein